MLLGEGSLGRHGFNLVATALANHTGEASSAGEIALVVSDLYGIGGRGAAFMYWGGHRVN